MNNNKYTVIIKSGVKRGFELKTLKTLEDKIHYIGVWVNMVQF